MKDHRLRAPSTDGALLAVPSLDQVGTTLERNAKRLASWDYDVQGRSAGRLRAQVHHEVTAAARRFLGQHGLDVPQEGTGPSPSPLPPIVVTGHQPELFHAGVWVKNFATAGLARAHGGLGLNLIVDNDLPKASSVRVPTTEGGRARAVRVDFDHWKGESPYEDLLVQDEAAFASFRDRARAVLDRSIADPILDDFWPRAVRHGGSERSLGLRLALARRELEAAWGVSNLEIPLSHLCQTDGFFWFASHLLAHLPLFQEIHNRALAEYRAQYGIRSTHHPVAALVVQGDWREAPFWIWRQGEPRRRPLLVRQDRRTMLLRISGETDPVLELPLAPDREACCAVERLRELAGKSIRFRTRALTTTLFNRYFLGDLFIHGIGGAKYDELGDSIARRFFGVEPPGFLTLSLTTWLGLSDRPGTDRELASIERQLRDLAYNPDRYLSEPLSPKVRNLVVAKREWIERESRTRKDRVARFHGIRKINEILQPFVTGLSERIQLKRNQIVADLEWNRLAHNREYSFVLHSARRLHAIMSGASSTQDA
jgi:hypothetical protein